MREDPHERVGLSLAGHRPKGRALSVLEETRPSWRRVEKAEARQRVHHIGVGRAMTYAGSDGE